MIRKLIIASHRTDIPAFHSRWLLGRLEAGSCAVIRHYGAGRIEVSLRAEEVLAIVF